MTYSLPEDVDKKEVLQVKFMTCRTSLFHLVCMRDASNGRFSNNTKAHAIRKEYFSGFSIEYTISQRSELVSSC